MVRIINNTDRLNRKELLRGVGIFALALLVRLVYLYGISDAPIFSVPIIDSATYNKLARWLTSGCWVDSRFFWQGIFYPFFLSRLHFFSGNSVVFARLFQAVLGSGLCVMVYFLGKRLFDSRVGILAGVILAFYGPVIFFESELLATGWACIWSVVLVSLFLRAGKENNSNWLYFVLGLCCGLSIITRATFAGFIGAAIIWLAVILRRKLIQYKIIAVREGYVIIGMVLILASTAGMNFSETGNFSAFANSGSINLFIGNNPQSRKMVMARPGTEWLDITRLAVKEGAQDSGQARDFFMKQFTGYLKTQPCDYLKGLLYKTVQFFSSREIPRNLDVYTLRNYSHLLSVLTWKYGGFGFPFGVLLPLSLLGIIFHWRRIPVPIILFLIFYPLAVILVFVTARYRAPIVPILCVPAAAGCLKVFDTIRARDWLFLLLMISFIIVAGWLCSIAGPFGPENFNYHAEMYYCRSFQDRLGNRPEEGIYHLSEAIRLDPDYFTANKGMGHALYKQGKVNEAIGYFRKSLQINPESDSAHYYLAVALLDVNEIGLATEHLRKALYSAEGTGKDRLVRKIKRKLEAIAGRTDFKGKH
jgi:4-amino-4-deoxy-L-arabinose transferase-like glycosyltransferase